MIGDVGREGIVAGLSGGDFRRFIETFQRQNALSAQFAADLDPLQRLLDMHGVPRREMNARLMAAVRAELVAVLGRLPCADLEALLADAFQYIRIPELRPVALAALEAHKHTPEAFLRQIGANPDIYATCPLPVRRQVWFVEPSLLRAELAPLILAYGEETRTAGTGTGAAGSRRPPAAKRIAELAGEDAGAYDLIVRAMRGAYAETGDAKYCALRCDVLMELHDAGVSEVYDQDPAHALIWCLDACARDCNIDAKRAKEIRNAEAVLTNARVTEVAMAAANPTTVAAAVANAVRAAHVGDEAVLATACRLVALADESHELVRDPSRELSRDAPDMIATFLKALQRSPVSSLMPMLLRSRACRMVFLHYVASRAPQLGSSSLIEYLSCAVTAAGGADDPSFVRSIVASAVSSRSREHVVAVFESLLPRRASPVVCVELLSLVPKMPHADVARSVCSVLQGVAMPPEIFPQISSALVPITKVLGERVSREAHPDLFAIFDMYLAAQH
jgi:hypothetical protein